MRTRPPLESRWWAARRDLRPAVCCYCSLSLLCIFTAQKPVPRESQPGLLHVCSDRTEPSFFLSYLSSRSCCLFCFIVFYFILSIYRSCCLFCCIVVYFIIFYFFLGGGGWFCFGFICFLFYIGNVALFCPLFPSARTFFPYLLRLNGVRLNLICTFLLSSLLSLIHVLPSRSQSLS